MLESPFQELEMCLTGRVPANYVESPRFDHLYSQDLGGGNWRFRSLGFICDYVMGSRTVYMSPCLKERKKKKKVPFQIWFPFLLKLAYLCLVSKSWWKALERHWLIVEKLVRFSFQWFMFIKIYSWVKYIFCI